MSWTASSHDAGKDQNPEQRRNPDRVEPFCRISDVRVSLIPAGESFMAACFDLEVSSVG